MNLTKLPGLVEHIPEGVHNFAADTFKLALSNTAPESESTSPASSTTACVLASVTEIAYTNLSSLTLTTAVTVLPEAALLVPQTHTLTASGAVPEFRWVYLYNNTTTAVTKPLLGYYDLGTPITLANTDTVTLAFNPEEGALAIGSALNSFSVYYASWARQTYGWEAAFAVDWWAE